MIKYFLQIDEAMVMFGFENIQPFRNSQAQNVKNLQVKE